MNNLYKDHTLNEFYQLALGQINYNVRKDTAKDRIRRVELHVIPYIGNVKIKDLTPLKLEGWQYNLLRLRGANQTRRCKQLLKAILDRAIVYEIISSNPIPSIAKIREPQSTNREIYTKKEIETILNGAKGQTRLFILSMVSLGVRSGEAIALKFSDINHANRTIRVQRAIRRGEVKSTKTGIIRDVDIPINLYSELVEWQKTNPNQKYIFTTQKGTPYKESSSFLRRHFKPLLEHLGVDYKGLYTLRATYATLQLRGGQDDIYIANQLGHTSTRTTRDYYIKYLKDDNDLRKTDSILSFGGVK